MDISAEKEKEPQEKAPEKSYLSGAIESISPWGTSRSTTPKPPPTARAGPGEGSGLKNVNQHGGYQNSHQLYGLSSRKYPNDCPPLVARWFYAVDVRIISLQLTMSTHVTQLESTRRELTAL